MPIVGNVSLTCQLTPKTTIRALFRSYLLVLCGMRQPWSPVVVTTQSVGLFERLRSQQACMYPCQPLGKIWSVVAARQSENDTDG